MNRIELLAPAGNLEKLKIAIMYGADAVFLGGKQFSLRSAASNFSFDDIKEGVEFAKTYDAKIYVVVNIIFHNQDVEGLKEYLMELEGIGVSGIICADLIVVDYLKKYAPKLEIHISTQQSITNSAAIKYYEKLGANRVVLAREVSGEELAILCEKANVEIEYFVHGAMCVAYSGRCMLSNYYSKRDSNRGGCSQSCRWNYCLWQEQDENLVKLNSEDCFYTMSSKDLALAASIPELIEIGVNSLKIEGRMKSIYYLATIISAYRNIIDDYYAQKEMNNHDLNQLNKAANRMTGTGFYDGIMDYTKQLYQNREEHPTKEFIGYVIDYDESKQLVQLEQRNYFEVGDRVEFFGPNKEFYEFVISKLYDDEMNEISVARHPQQVVYLPFDKKISKHSMLRKKL